MAEKLLLTPRPPSFNPGKPIFPTDRMHDNLKLNVFIGENSWLLFHNLKTEGLWLSEDVEQWEFDAEFTYMHHLLHDLKVVNDLAERCVKDVEEFVNASKDPEHRDNILLVATDHRGALKT